MAISSTSYKKGHNVSEEIRGKIRQAMIKNPVRYWLGKKRPKISKKHREILSKRMSGDKNPLWKGSDVGYVGLHIWVKKHKGSPKKCEHCGEKKKRINWANKSHNYLRNLDDWLSLCVKCHRAYDKKYV